MKPDLDHDLLDRDIIAFSVGDWLPCAMLGNAGRTKAGAQRYNAVRPIRRIDRSFGSTFFGSSRKFAMLPGWSQIDIAGKPADVFDPSAPPRLGLLFLHNVFLETLANNPVYTAILRERNLACVCPHGQHSWWLDRVCPEFDPKLTAEKHVVEQVLPFFQSRWNIPDRGVGLFGISMGGQGALRIAFRHPKLFVAAAGIAPAIDFQEAYGSGISLDDMFDSKEQARQDTATMHIHPYDYPPHLFFAIDPEDHDWYRGNDRLHEKLGALGVPHTIDFTTTGGGHSWEYFDRMAEPAIRFLVEGLEKESRRLL
jgi:hypothetical protein